MERRKFLTAMGSLAAGGAAVMGTGAFERTSAARDARVEVVGDASAYLGLNPTSPYAGLNNGELNLDFGAASGNGGRGLNQDAVVSFRGLFDIENQGTETIGVFIQDGRSQTEQGSTTGDGDLNEKLANQGFIPGETSAGFFVDTGSGGEESLSSSTWAPDTVNTTRLDDPNAWDPVLAPGDSISVGWFMNGENSDLGEVNGEVALWGYSQTFAQAYQS
jgi:hypothetical protein